MKNLPLLLVALLVMPSSVYAETPARRERILHDTVGIHHVNPELRKEIREDKKELLSDRKEMREDKRRLHKDRHKLRSENRQDRLGSRSENRQDEQGTRSENRQDRQAIHQGGGHGGKGHK